MAASSSVLQRLGWRWNSAQFPWDFFVELFHTYHIMCLHGCPPHPIFRPPWKNLGLGECGTLGGMNFLQSELGKQGLRSCLQKGCQEAHSLHSAGGGLWCHPLSRFPGDSAGSLIGRKDTPAILSFPRPTPLHTATLKHLQSNIVLRIGESHIHKSVDKCRR